MTDTTPFRIVCGVDFSEIGDVALAHALRLAAGGGEGGELHVVHVATPDDFAKSHGSVHERRSILAETIPIDVWNRIYRVGQAETGLPHMRVSVHVRFGEPASAIHQVAVDYDADLIVVGTHGRRGIQKLVIGSVAEQLVRIARVPVTVVRPKNFAGLAKSDRVEAPHPPGEQLPTERPDTHVYGSTRLMNWTRAPADIEGVRLY